MALTTHRLDSPGSFHAAVRKSIDAGLKPEEALACVTTRPARLLGIESLAGTVEPGRIANLLVVDGELFAEGTDVREVWVAGRRSEIKAPTKFMIGGTFDVVVDGTVRENLKATIDPDRNRLTITTENEEPEADAKDEEGEEGEEGEEADDADDADEADEAADEVPGQDDPVSGVWDCMVEIPNMGEIPMTMTFTLTPDDRVTGGITNPMFNTEVSGRFDRAASSIDLTVLMEQGQSSNMDLKIAGNTSPVRGAADPAVVRQLSPAAARPARKTVTEHPRRQRPSEAVGSETPKWLAGASVSPPTAKCLEWTATSSQPRSSLTIESSVPCRPPVEVHPIRIEGEA